VVAVEGLGVGFPAHQAEQVTDGIRVVVTVVVADGFAQVHAAQGQNAVMFGAGGERKLGDGNHDAVEGVEQVGVYTGAAPGPVAHAVDAMLAAGAAGITGQRLAFSFEGLVIASMVYSLPFVVQPLQNSFRQLPDSLLETAKTLGAGYWDRWFSIILPMCRSGFISAATLGFAHTVGEFGVVLMIGGSLPGSTRVVSVQLYDHVEALDYGAAHGLAGVLLGFAFLTLLLLYLRNPQLRSFG